MTRSPVYQIRVPAPLLAALTERGPEWVRGVLERAVSEPDAGDVEDRLGVVEEQLALLLAALASYVDRSTSPPHPQCRSDARCAQSDCPVCAS